MPESFAELFLKAMRYEHWLRFYFLEDADSQDDSPMQSSPERELSVEDLDAVLSVPENFVSRSRIEEPELAEILEKLQGRNVSMERSRDVILHWLGEKTGIRPGSAEFEERLNELSSDQDFRRALDFFHGWVQELANNEIDLKGNALPPDAPRDETVPSFAEWDKAFQFWFGLQKPFEIGKVPS